MLAEITYLREVAQKCRSGAALEPKLASWLGSCLENYLNYRARDMDDAFSLRNGRGGVPWWMEEALHKRDAALRKLSESHFIGLSPTACARKIRESSERYKGTPKQYLWKAFQSGAPMPIGERQLRAILSTHSKRSESQVRKFNAFPISNVRCQNDHVEATSI